MTTDSEALARLLAYHDHIAVPPHAVVDDVRRGQRRLRRRRAVLAGGMALGAAALTAAATLVSGGGGDERQQLAGPATTPAPAESASSGWEGPLRGGRMPVDDVDGSTWTDARDAADGVIDIQAFVLEDRTSDGHLDWVLRLREPHPPTSTVDSAQRVIEYGLVVDADGDRVADCQIGINNDARKRGDYRVWVKNLRTGAIDEREGPPYGVPVDFRHPGEPWTPTPGDPASDDSPDSQMGFWFLQTREGRWPPTGPCEAFSASARVYAWASVTDQGRVTGWDFAPDAAWLNM